MKKYKLFLPLSIVCFLLNATYAQQFISEGGKINDFKVTPKVDTFNVKIKGLKQQIDKSFGIAKVCLSISHPRVSDLKIELQSPNGVSIWLSNRNGRDDGRHFQNTCFTSNGFSGYIHQAKAPFEGEYIPDGRFSFLNNGQNPNGIWKLLITDLKQGEEGSLHFFRLDFSENPMPNNETPPCSFENTAKCYANSSNGELLPDLIMLQKFTENQIKEYSKDDPYYPGQLRFAATIANIGDGPMEILGLSEWYCGEHKVDSLRKCNDGTYPRQRIYQRIYYKKDDTLVYKNHLAGTNYYDDKPGHNHFHVDDWVEFRLKKKCFLFEKIIVKGSKVSYCLFDSGICNQRDSLCLENGLVYGERNLKNYGLGNYAECKSKVQGISVGGYDTYGMMYEGQFIQLPKKMKSGKYILEIEIDPNHLYKEKNKKNNTLRIPIIISKQV